MMEEDDIWVNCHGCLAEGFASKEAWLQSFVPEGENIQLSQVRPYTHISNIKLSNK